jgi:hypothetical protein
MLVGSLEFLIFLVDILVNVLSNYVHGKSY